MQTCLFAGGAHPITHCWPATCPSLSARTVEVQVYNNVFRTHVPYPFIPHIPYNPLGSAPNLTFFYLFIYSSLSLRLHLALPLSLALPSLCLSLDRPLSHSKLWIPCVFKCPFCVCHDQPVDREYILTCIYICACTVSTVCACVFITFFFLVDAPNVAE